jgi:hypothetical protein
VKINELKKYIERKVRNSKRERRRKEKIRTEGTE